MKVSTVQQMRDLDRQAIEKYGITQEILMENAGQASFFTILKNMDIAGRRFVFFCGVGNNGGDGLVVARKIHSNGGEARVFILGDPGRFKGSAALNFRIAQKLKLPMETLKSIRPVNKAISEADVIVDAIFGTGLTRTVEGLYRKVIDAINDSGKPVVSIDIPSGINGDNGQIMGTAVRANFTVTFGLPKLGNLLYPGFEHGGQLSVTHISFPPELHDSDDLYCQLNLPPTLPQRSPAAHKGDVGKGLFIAGAANYFGAPYFSAFSFLKAGGGLAFLASTEQVTAQVGGHGPEIIMLPQTATRTGSIALSNRDTLLEFSETADFVVLGPGLSLAQETQTLVRQLAVEIRRPLLIDGDGLTAIAQDPSLLPTRKAETVLTPHLGEMSRLTGISISEIRQDPVGVLRTTSRKLRSIIILKGAHSLIGLPDGRVFINLSGNAGMATAGSGDVLTGTIAAMFGLGLNVEQAVQTGVFLHGFAGDLSAREIGEDGVTAQTILNSIPEAVRRFRDDRDRILANNYNKVFLI